MDKPTDEPASAHQDHGTKICNTCAEARPPRDFSRDASTSDGLNRRCRPCMSTKRKAYRAIITETGPLYNPKRFPGQRGCDIPTCDGRHYGHGWCEVHHRNWTDRGDPLALPVRINGGPCTVGTCTEQAVARGWCRPHYGSWRRHGDPLIRVRTGIPNDGRCAIEDCPDEPTSGTSKWCRTHYSRWSKSGDPLIVTVDRRAHARSSRCQYCSAPTVRRMFCSEKCATRHLRGTPPVMACQMCGAPFPTNEKNTCCSDACRLELKRLRNRNWMRQARATDLHHRDAHSRDSQARRARTFGALVETISPLEIHQRDDWTCGICHEPIDPDARWPDRWCATIDHRIPLSRGGQHERSNVQSAHLTCNCSKNGRLLVEVAD